MITPAKSILLLCFSLLASAALACSLGGQGAAATPPSEPPEEATVQAQPSAAPASALPATAVPATQGPGGLAGGYQTVIAAPEGAGEAFGRYASLVLDAENDPIIAYVSADPNADGDASDSEMLVVSWDRASGAWRAPVRVATVGETSAGRPAYQISLARDAGTGGLALAYVAKNLGELWLASSSDGGLTWSTEQVQTPGEGHNYLGPVVALAKGVTHLAVADSNNNSTYLSRTTTSGSFNVTPLPLAPGTEDVQYAQPGLALDSAGRPGMAYWLVSSEDGGLALAYWRPGDPAPTRITDTGGTQNDTPFVALAYAGDQPVVAFAAILGYDPATNDTTGDVWAARPNPGGQRAPIVAVPRDGGQSMAGPLALAVSAQGEGAIGPWVAGGNLEGTVCGRPKLARSGDGKTWQTCSPDPSEDTNWNTGFVGAAFGSDGKLSLVIQNVSADGLPAGLIFWREP
ncbi:MAG: hypothetical protein ABI847_06330 [Anaerolineales bacterium]